MEINKTRIIQRIYGLILILFGMNGYFSFLPIPEKQGFAFEFLNILHHAGYIFPVVATIMTTAGFLFLIDRWVAFALLTLLPISFNIFAFHLFHDWQGLVMAYILFGLNNFLILRRFKQFRILFTQSVGEV